MRLTILTLVVGVMVLGLIFELLRRRQLREKYAVLWLTVAVLILPLAAFPRLLDGVAHVVGVVSGISLVLFLGLILVLLICLHLSWESSRLEEETRTLAEEVALIRLRQEALEAGRDAGQTRGRPVMAGALKADHPDTARSTANPAADGSGAAGADH